LRPSLSGLTALRGLLGSRIKIFAKVPSATAQKVFLPCGIKPSAEATSFVSFLLR